MLRFNKKTQEPIPMAIGDKNQISQKMKNQTLLSKVVSWHWVLLSYLKFGS